MSLTELGEDTAQLEVDIDKQAPSEQQVVPHNKVSEIISETIDVLFNFFQFFKYSKNLEKIEKMKRKSSLSHFCFEKKCAIN